MNTQSKIVRSQSAKALHNLSIHFDRNQPLTVIVESARRMRLTHQTVIKRHRGIRRKTKQKPPQRLDQHSLEYGSSNQCQHDKKDSAYERVSHDPGEPKTNQQTEQDSRRCKRQECRLEAR